MQIFSNSIRVLVVLACSASSVARCTSAQSNPRLTELTQRLESEQTTDAARDELLKQGKSDPEARQYLVVRIPTLIDSGPGAGKCPATPCRAWRNAVELATRLKIGEAAPALARWIAVKDVNPWPGIGPYGGKLETNPAALALASIGDPAIPALEKVLDSGTSNEHALAMRVLGMINTPKAKAVLRDDLQRETDPDLQAMIKRELSRK